MLEKDKKYLDLILEPIKICANYKPKLGHGKKDGYSLNEFQNIYSQDPFYNWIGLDNPLMYAAHKVAGGMTSIYRQIGIGCERLFRKMLQDSLNLSEEDVKWSYTIRSKGKEKSRTLYLDACITLEKLTDTCQKERIHNWIIESAKQLDIEPKIIKQLNGIVFEIRQGYKSKDSKRQNADIANAATAYTKGYLPCAGILSQQIDNDISYRYKLERWVLLTGILGQNNSLISIYDFSKDIIGFDLADFFIRNKEILRKEIDIVLQKLLSAAE